MGPPFSGGKNSKGSSHPSRSETYTMGEEDAKYVIRDVVEGLAYLS